MKNHSMHGAWSYSAELGTISLTLGTRHFGAPLPAGRRGTAVGNCESMPPTNSLLVLDEDEHSHPNPQALPLLDPLAVAAADPEYVEKTEGVLDADADRSKQMLALSFLALVVVGVFNTVFSKLQSLPMATYVNFSNLFVTFAYIPLSLLWVVPMARMGKIPKADLNMSKKPFMVMGLLDAMSGLMLFYALVQLSVDLANLLQQSAIPISMIISKLLLKVKYSHHQYCGAAIVAVGIAIVLLPHLSAGGESGVLRSATILILSCVPMTLSSVYKEIALGERDLDPTFLNLWVALFQFLFSLPLAIPTSYAQGIGITELPRNLWRGVQCYLGRDPVPVAAVNQCAFQGPLFINVYIFVNFAYNILINFILKHGSANMLWLALTTRVPITNILNSVLTFLPGHKPMGPTDVWGLVVIMLGLIMYRFGHAAWTHACAWLGQGGSVVKASASVPSATTSVASDYADLNRPLLLDQVHVAEEGTSGSTNMGSCKATLPSSGDSEVSESPQRRIVPQKSIG